ncbi:decapping and exoribonuclease protein-like [Antedon mediterranea]|uniref:decapping and exoribonuclease protein-like n=1 Tax=Antedon mediterranea TaxID=105859 RepID=UPI003AF9414F
MNYDLRRGYKQFEEHDLNEGLDNIMKWILKKRDLFKLEPTNSKIKSLDKDFVGCRGHFTKIMCTPYLNKEEWIMAVTLYRGTYYINQVATEEKKDYLKKMSGEEKEIAYWGYKFEQYMTSVDGKEPPNTNEALNNNEAYFSVVQSDINDHSLMYSGEVDCCTDVQLQPPSNYVELKTYKVFDPTDEKENNKFKRYKLSRWWAQSYLLGIPTIMVGFRNEKGIVQNVERYPTIELPEKAKQNKIWCPEVCMHFCDSFLKHVKKLVIKDDPCVVYLFKRLNDQNGITCTLEENSSHKFVQEWYTREFV